MAGLSPNAPRFLDAFRKAAVNKRLWRISRKRLPRGFGRKIKRLRARASPGDPKFWSRCERLARLANISGKEAAQAFEKAGWQRMGQVGSHLVMVKPGLRVNLSVPQHKELSIGTLRALIRHAGMTVDEFLSLL